MSAPATFTDSPVVLNLPPIEQGQDWSWTFQVLQAGTAITGGAGTDGVATFDGITVVAGATLSNNVYSLSRNVIYSTCTLSNGVTVNTNGFTLSSVTAATVGTTSQIVSPVDLTGSTFLSKLKAYLADTAALYSFTPAVVNATGKVTLSIPNATTDGFGSSSTVNKFYYDVFWTDATPAKKMLFRGEIPFIKAVSR